MLEPLLVKSLTHDTNINIKIIWYTKIQRSHGCRLVPISGLKPSSVHLQDHYVVYTKSIERVGGRERDCRSRKQLTREVIRAQRSGGSLPMLRLRVRIWYVACEGIGATLLPEIGMPASTSSLVVELLEKKLPVFLRDCPLIKPGLGYGYNLPVKGGSLQDHGC